MSNQPEKLNDITYGKATIKAVKMNEWILFNGDTTTSHKEATAEAVRINKILGGKTMPAQRMSSSLQVK